MFIVTRNQVLVGLFGVLFLALVVYLKAPVVFGLLDLVVVAASGLAVSLPIWEEHRRREISLDAGKISGVTHITYVMDSTGLSPVTVHRNELEAVLVQVPAKAHPFLVQTYRVRTLDQNMTLKIIVNGDQSVIAFQPRMGTGHRVIVATAQLPFVLW